MDSFIALVLGIFVIYLLCHGVAVECRCQLDNSRREGSWIQIVLSGTGLLLVCIYLLIYNEEQLYTEKSMYLTGLLLSTGVCLPQILRDNAECVQLSRRGHRIRPTPLRIWFHLASRGIGKYAHGLLISTLIGIPFWRLGLQNVKRISARAEYENRQLLLKEIYDGTQAENIMREAAREVAAKHQNGRGKK